MKGFECQVNYDKEHRIMWMVRGQLLTARVMPYPLICHHNFV